MVFGSAADSPGTRSHQLSETIRTSATPPQHEHRHHPAPPTKHNILIKNAATLEAVSRIQTVVLDKTGTLTAGKPTVTDIVPGAGVNEAEVLRAASAIAGQSTHPLSQAIVTAATARDARATAPAEQVTNVAGQGVRDLAGVTFLVGNAALLSEAGVEVKAFDSERQRLATSGRSLVYVAVGGRLAGLIGITDPVRPTSRQAIADLKAMGIKPMRLSSDLEATARWVAAEVGIEEGFAEVRPAQKAEYVKRMQAEGRFTAMVGGGVNDVPALAQADIGFAIGAGTDVAIQATQVVLMKSDPLDVARAVRLSKAPVREMRQNLAWAGVYNLVAIPVAGGVFYHSLGWSLRPEVSALLMSASSIIVALTAVSLRGAKI